MRTAVRDWFTARLATSAERLGENLRAEVEKQGWPQPPIRTHRRYWPTPVRPAPEEGWVMTDMPTPEIEVLKPPIGSYVAMVFRVDGYDPDVGETQETATMARLTAVDVNGEESGWEVSRVGLYNTTDRVVTHPRDALAPAPSDPGSSRG